MASIKSSVHLLLFSFLVKAVQCTLTTTNEPLRRPIITSDNIPPFPAINETDSDTQDSSKDSDGTSDEMKTAPDNNNITDNDTETNVEARGLFDHLTKMNPIRSKQVRRQLNGVNLLNNYNSDSTLQPTNQDMHQKSPNNQNRGRLLYQGNYQPFADQDRSSSAAARGNKQIFGSNSLLSSNDRGRPLNQALARQGSVTTEEIPPISNNRQVNQQQDVPAPTVGDKGILGSINQPFGDNNRGMQYNRQVYQPLNNQDRFPSDSSRFVSNNRHVNQQQDIPAATADDKGIFGSISQPIGDNNGGRQYNHQVYQPLNNQDRFPLDDSRFASNNRQTNKQPNFPAPNGRYNDILGSVNLPFATQYNNTPYKSDSIACDRRGMCSTVTQKDLFQNTYKLIEQFSSDQYESTMCFTEIIYVTEIDFSDTLLISKEIVWTIETTDHKNTLDDASCSNFLDAISNPPLELINTEQFEGRVVKEYRIKHCGVGNIFKHEYSSWPNSDRRMIQVTISNSSLLQCRRQQDRNSNLGEQLHTTTLNPLTYRSTFDERENMNTFVTEMPKPSSVEQPTSSPGETIDGSRITPGPPVVQAQRGVAEFDDSGENSEENLKDYMKIIIDCVLKNKNFKGMCPHSAKSRN